MNLARSALTVALFAFLTGNVLAAVSQQEADQLGGDTLTEFGAEKAGNADGTIPPYTGGLSVDTAPAGWKKDSGRYDHTPFDDEKALFSIDAGNMDKYADKLTAGAMALMKKYPDYRVIVYPTHRSVSYPSEWLTHCKSNATTVKLTASGNGIIGGHSCVPFPIPKNGLEASWNYQLRNVYATHAKYLGSSWLLDGNGHITDIGHTVLLYIRFWAEPGKTSDPDIYDDHHMADFAGPPSQVGTKVLQFDSIDYDKGDQLAWFYSPGQRRTRLAPEFAYDTPIAPYGGAISYDESFGFNGKPDRFDFQLIGKKEIYVPYNSNKLLYLPIEQVISKKGFVDPDTNRFELHRVWVVDSKLKPGKRHIYSRRTFYIDEDSWAIVASDSYDQSGKLYRAGFFPMVIAWDKQSFAPVNHYYDLTRGTMLLGPAYNRSEDYLHINNGPIPADVVTLTTADSLAGRGVR